VSVRALVKRQHYSQVSHIERIRGNSPPQYKSEEVMKLKNELAMQRVLRLQRQNKAALPDYSPLKKYEVCGGSSPGSEVPLPSERLLSQQRRKQIHQLLE
jgi:hypothetical protein